MSYCMEKERAQPTRSHDQTKKQTNQNCKKQLLQLMVFFIYIYIYYSMVHKQAKIKREIEYFKISNFPP